MSHLMHSRRLRHLLIAVLIALVPLVILAPVPSQVVQQVTPSAPPTPVALSAAIPPRHTPVPTELPLISRASTSSEPVPTEPAIVQTEPASSAQTGTDNKSEFSVYLPQLTHSNIPSQQPQVSALRSQSNPSCLEFKDIRITWYELGSCCNKTPDHPAYGITRSGLTVQWGMAAVQADTPLVPLGTTVIVKDLGSTYPMVVTDTGSETAFGSAWLDIYAPSVEIGYWLEQQVGRDGRSDVLVCPTTPR